MASEADVRGKRNAYFTRLGGLQRLVESFDPCLLTITELADLAHLATLHPQGIPDEVQALFVRGAVVQRVIHYPGRWGQG